MSNFFEGIKTTIFKSFLNKKNFDLEKDDNNLNKKKHLEKLQNERDSDETSILLEEDNNRYLNENNLNNRRLLSTTLINNKILPLMYFTFAFSSVLFLMLSENIRNSENYILIEPTSHKKLFNFFKLYNLNPLIYHIFSMTTGLIGIGIVCLVQNAIYIKNLNLHRMMHQFSLIKIYMTSLFGISSQLTHIICGMIYFFSSFAKFDSFVQKELNISLHQFLFCIEIFFTVLYGIFVCIILNQLNKVDVLETENEQDKFNTADSFNYSKSNENCFYKNPQNNNYQLHIIPDNFESKWLNYKIICIIYLIFFSICYTLLSLIKNDKINLIDKDTAYFRLNQNYLLIFLPYFIYTLNAIFYSLFYGVLKYSSTCHIEFTSQIVYDKSQKNML